ncbi:MAG: DUF6036 family nucleotidyltransferase [Candidatus Nanoarchaeia archaeon]|jgi:hypothetical protein
MESDTRIDSFKEIKDLFIKIDKSMIKEIEIYIIGGAALLFYGVGKGYTKDIDIVLSKQDEFEELCTILKKEGFIDLAIPKTHNQMSISARLKQYDFIFDLFLQEVCHKFSLSSTMKQRAIKLEISMNNMKIYVCSKEDIVLFKSLSSDRPNDVEDSIDLIKRGIDWDIFYKELVTQTNICSDKEKAKNMVFYILERITLNLEPKGIRVPIKEKIEEFYESLD